MLEFIGTILDGLKQYIDKKTVTATEEDTLNMLTELELIDPMTDESGALLTDENGAVYIL